jgi:hypothetical protein
MIEFNFIKRIETEEESIFYSLAEYKGEIIGVARKSALQYYMQSKIKHVKFDNDFTIIKDNILMYTGEDPRSFLHDDKLYVLDNTYNAMNLIEYDTGKRIPIGISGKNISFISHNNTLYFIHYLKPFTLFEYDLDFQSLRRVEVNDDGNTYNYEYRGGTSGYSCGKDTYYGFGHRTYYKDSTLIHDIFKWVVLFGERPSIQIIEVKQPVNSKNICDPTSVVYKDCKRYLITAESDTHWFEKQDFVTNVYEIVE